MRRRWLPGVLVVRRGFGFRFAGFGGLALASLGLSFLPCAFCALCAGLAISGLFGCEPGIVYAVIVAVVSFGWMGYVLIREYRNSKRK